MKTILYVLFILFISIRSQAQITLTSGNCIPQVGDTFFYYYSNSVSQGNSGANITWDFSGLDSSEMFVKAFPLQSTMGGNLNSGYPLNIGSQELNSNMGYSTYISTLPVFFRYRNSNDTLSLIKREIVMCSWLTYIRPKLVLSFPLTYNNQAYTDSFSALLDGVSAGCGSDLWGWDTGTVVVTSDAYGTLILPDTTYNDVLRIKRVTTGHTFKQYGNQYISADADFGYEEYEWYNGVHEYPVLIIKKELYNTSVNAISRDEDDISVFPNPASDLLNISVKGEAVRDIELINITGQVLQTISGVANRTDYAIDVSHQGQGVYFVRIVTPNGISMKKVMVR